MLHFLPPKFTPLTAVVLHIWLLQVDNRPPISTHVLDTSRGTPVQNLEVSLYQLIDGRWTLINDW